MTDTLAIKVTKATSSKLSKVDYENLPFGKTFTDHMLTADYANGEWKNFEIVPFGEIGLSPAISALHYGQTFFEGLKAYKHDDGKISIFRPDKNAKRFNKSADRMCMPGLPEELFLQSIAAVVDLDRDWVPSKKDYTLYIRPFMFATDPYLGVAPSTTYKFMVLLCPTGPYFSKNLNVKIETEYTRSAEGGFGYAKAAGNYAGSLFPGKKASEQGFDQILWTDAKTHEYVEEMGAANAMFVINGKLVTPSTRDTILDGVTRDSIITLAKEWGMEVEERRVSVLELVKAIEDGSCTDAFGAGTAATIASVSEISLNDKVYVLPDPAKSVFANKMRKALDDIKYGRVEDSRNWNYII
nr:branched-chain amino acid aminotransferase [uncultured Pedobacter sp.]